MVAKIDSIRPNPENTLAMAISAACAGVPAVQAQAVLEEITVTATKREANLQDVALAITAFGTEEIVRQGFKTFSDYVGQIPALSVVARTPGATNVLMRGCATQGLSFSDSSTTSVYLDEQPITAAGYNPDPRLVDIERVEALGGPQGTLFGDAAQCGTLRIITNKPDADQFSSWVDVTGMTVDGGDAGYDVSAMVNIPIIKDTLALRLVGFAAEEPGYIDNVLSTSPGSAPILGQDPVAGQGPIFGVDPAENFDNSAFVDDDVNTGTYYGGRVGLRWNAAENWTVDLTGGYQKYELDGFGDVDLNNVGGNSLDVSPGSLYSDTSVFPTLGDYDQIRFSTDDWEDEWYQAALTVEGNLGFADLVVAGAYFSREAAYNADATTYLQAFNQTNTYVNTNISYPGTSYYCNNYPAYSYICNLYDFNGDPRANDFDGREIDSFTFEARLSSPTDSDSRWGWLGGVFYNHRELEELFTSNVNSGAGLPLWDAYYQQTLGGYYLQYSVYNQNAPSSALSNNWFSGTYLSELDQWAVFGEFSFNFTDNFSVTVGGRYYDIENDWTVVQGALIGLNGGPMDCTVPGGDFCWTGSGNTTGEGTDDGFVPKLNLTYRWTDQLVYFTYSEGFRRGGANSARPQSIFGGTPGFGGNPAAGSFPTYEGDTVNNWEVGAKTEWLDNSLRFNITAYYMEWEDIQIQIEDPSDALFSLGVVNAPQADIIGVDSWLDWAPTENWDFSATLGYNKGELVEDFIFRGNVLVTDGTQLPLMPDWKGSLNATYTFGGKLFSATPYVLAQYVYWGESTNSIGLETTSFTFPVREQPAWQTLGLRVGLDGETWRAVVYVDNIFDEYQELFYNNRWAQQRLSVGQPRTFGVNFRKSFGGN